MVTVCSEEWEVYTQASIPSFFSENVKVRVEFEDIRITKRWALQDQSVKIGVDSSCSG
jgi:hypothetical protein